MILTDSAGHGPVQRIVSGGPADCANVVPTRDHYASLRGRTAEGLPTTLLTIRRMPQSWLWDALL